MSLTRNHRIGDLPSESEVFYAINPATAEMLPPSFKDASEKEINVAIESAHRTFQQYRNKSGNERADFLETIGEEIMALGEKLIKRANEETGLSVQRLTGERTRTVSQLRLFAQLLREGSWVDARIDGADPARKPVRRPDIRSMQIPLGAVGVFGASNFPFAFSVAGGDTVSALAAGCPVIFKAHPAHPGTSELFNEAIRLAVKKAMMPEGIFSMVQGRSTRVGMAIVRHPLIKAIEFTGSLAGGRALFNEASKRAEPIPVYAEMGSSNPVFILPRMLKEKGEEIAKDLVASVTLGAGQFCTNPGLIFLQQSEETTAFKNNLIREINETKAEVMLTSAIRNSYQEKIERLRNEHGLIVLAKGSNHDEETRGTAYLLHIYGDLFLQNKTLEDEVFGPSTLAVTTNDKAQLLQVADRLGSHLTATVHGTEDDLQDYAELIPILEQKVGRILLNGYPTGVEVCHAMVHGGPYPATTDSRTTSVGTRAICRFTRPVCYQDFTQSLLPAELKDINPLEIWRLINGKRTRE